MICTVIMGFGERDWELFFGDFRWDGAFLTFALTISAFSQVYHVTLDTLEVERPSKMTPDYQDNGRLTH